MHLIVRVHQSPPGASRRIKGFDAAREPRVDGDKTMTMPDTELPDQGTGKARDQIREMKDQVLDQARTGLRQARDQAGSSLADSRRQAAGQVGEIAKALHRTGEHLRGENQARIAGLADSLAERVDRVGRYLEQAEAKAVARDLENLSRRQPGLVFGAAFALGLLGARFLKSSKRARDDEEYGGYDRIRAGGEPAGLGAGGFHGGA
jgi:hypothetical protein